MANISGKQIIIGLIALVVLSLGILFVYPGYWKEAPVKTGPVLTGDITIGANGLTNGTHTIVNINGVATIVKNAPVANTTLPLAIDNTKKDTTTSNELVLSLADFKDWVNGKISVTTSVKEVRVYESVEEAQPLFDNSWDKNLNRKMNIDIIAVRFANDLGDNDPIESIFFTSNNVFVVTKTTGLGAQVWSPNNDGKLQKVSSKQNVQGMDKLSKTA